MQYPRNFMQPHRRNALAQILRSETIGRQAELVALLRKRGFEATQSSISRDLRELGVAKQGDRYILNEAAARDDIGTLRRFVRSVAEAGPHLTVVKTTVGAAQSVAVAIDKAQWPEAAGTISGDDTIFIASANRRDQTKIRDRLSSLFGN